MKHWRILLARLPLPMLALAASYGVYSYALLFVPTWVAIVQASAFEGTYIGLAVSRDLRADDRRRATTISVGAVVASIIYNTLAGWFYRQPQLLESAGALAWLMLALLHGAPLAWVAYLVSDLLLHSGAQNAPTMEPKETRIYAIPKSIDAELLQCPNCGIVLDAARWRAARRWGHCTACKGSVVQVMNGKEH